jgi:hypothetical protein
MRRLAHHTLADRGYTGHLENMEIGLLYTDR